MAVVAGAGVVTGAGTVVVVAGAPTGAGTVATITGADAETVATAMGVGVVAGAGGGEAWTSFNPAYGSSRDSPDLLVDVVAAPGSTSLSVSTTDASPRASTT